MVPILVLSGFALVVAAVALKKAAGDFETGDTFERATASWIYLAWATHAAAFVVALWWDPYRLDLAATPPTVLGSLLALAGASLFVLGMSRFQSFGQVTGTEVGGLVTSGAYRYSRNPQYTGWVILFTGVAVTARSPLALMLALAVVAAMRIWIPHEERHLEKEFGEDYVEYRRQVPRFLRLNPGKQITH